MATYLSAIPFPQGVDSQLVSVSTPRKTGRNQPCMDALFYSFSGELRSVVLPYPDILHFQPGEAFRGTARAGMAEMASVHLHDASRDIVRQHIEPQTQLAVAPEKRIPCPAGCEEYVVVLETAQASLIVPCPQIVRFFCIQNSFLSKQLFSTPLLSGLFADLRAPFGTLYFEVLPALFHTFTIGCLRKIFTILLIPEVDRLWGQAHENLAAAEPFRVGFPAAAALDITLQGYWVDGSFYVCRMSWGGSPRLSFAGKTITALSGEVYRQEKRVPSGKKHRSSKSAPSDELTETSDAHSKKDGSLPVRRPLPAIYKLSLPRIDSRTPVQRTRSAALVSPEPQTFFSPGSPTANGSGRQAADGVETDFLFLSKPEPGFEAFCAMLDQLRSIPGIRDIRRLCGTLDGGAGHYLAAALTLASGTREILFEAEQFPERPSATAVAHLTGDPVNSFASAVRELADLFANSGCHWPRVLSDGASFTGLSTVRHFGSRGPRHWAALLCTHFRA